MNMAWSPWPAFSRRLTHHRRLRMTLPARMPWSCKKVCCWRSPGALMQDGTDISQRLSTGCRRDITHAQNTALTTTARNNSQTYQHWIAEAHVVCAPTIAKHRCEHDWRSQSEPSCIPTTCKSSLEFRTTGCSYERGQWQSFQTKARSQEIFWRSTKRPGRGGIRATYGYRDRRGG